MQLKDIVKAGSASGSASFAGWARLVGLVGHVTGIIAAFIGIKLIDLVITALHFA